MKAKTRGQWVADGSTWKMRVGSGRAHFTLRVSQTLGLKTWAWHVDLCGVTIDSGSAPEPEEGKRASVKAMHACVQKLYEVAMLHKEDES